MTFQTLTASQIQATAMNPRKFFNDNTIEELAQSIKTDGLLQNLVVLKPKGKSKKHNIVAGERRFRAVSLLIEKGDLPKDFPIAVEVKENLTDEEVLRIATVENVQRENLNPVEECEAVAALLQDGMALADVAAQTGLSEMTLKRRLALSNLADEAKAALLAGDISLSQAEALTLGNHDQQRKMIEDGLDHYDADDIRGRLTEEKANAAMAIFPREQYTGTYTSDLFASEETTFFDDAEQFLDLQKAAVTALAGQYKAEGFDPVEIIEGHGFQSWKYTKTKGKKKGGAVIEFRASGRVEIHTGLVPCKLDNSTAKATAESPFVKPKETYATPLRRHMNMHKSLAVQTALLSHPRKAKELAVCNALCGFSGHDCLGYFEKEEDAPPALAAINDEADILSGFFAEPEEDRTWRGIGYRFHHDEVAAYEAVQGLTDEQLERLLVVLEALSFGQKTTDRLDTNGDSLFNRIAKDLGVDMRIYWLPDDGFLKRRSREQLMQLIREAGLSGLYGNVSQYKKGELVKSLKGQFRRIRHAEVVTDAEQTARNWLPEAMEFPAIDPDRKDTPTELDDDEIQSEDDEISEEEDV